MEFPTLVGIQNSPLIFEIQKHKEMGLKELFVKGDEQAPVQQQQQSATPAQQPQPQMPPITPSPNVSSIQNNQSGNTISADPDIVNTIWQKIIEKNRPGPDYLELKNNVEALEDLPITPEQKILSAFKVLQKNYPNFKKEDITVAIDFYLKVVEEEKNTGLSELEALRMNTVDNVETEIKEMQGQAAELKRRYDELQEKIATKNIEMNKAKADVEMKYNVFTGSVEAVVGVLESDKQKIMTINF